MESREDLEKIINNLGKVIASDRVKLDQNVFVERHLPTIIKNGNLPTKEIQAELVKLAGNDVRIIDLVNEQGEIVISLPPAIGSSKTISNTDSKLGSLNRTFSDMAESIRMGNEEAAQQKLKSVLKDNKQDIINSLAENPWEKVVEYYNKGEVKTKPKKTNEKISFDYN